MTYYPNRSMKLIFPLIAVGAFGSLLILGGMVFEALEGKFAAGGLAVVTVMTALFLWGLKYLYDEMKSAVVFEEDGFTVIDQWGGRICRYRWQDFSCVCPLTNSKGHLFMVLSMQQLTQGNIKKDKRKWLSSGRMCREDAVVLRIDQIQKIAPQVRKLIEEKIGCVTEYRAF